ARVTVETSESATARGSFVPDQQLLAFVVLLGDGNLECRISQPILIKIAGFLFHQAVGAERRESRYHAGHTRLIRPQGLRRSDLPLPATVLREDDAVSSFLLEVDLGDVAFFQREDLGWSVGGSLCGFLRLVPVRPIKCSSQGRQNHS